MGFLGSIPTGLSTKNVDLLILIFNFYEDMPLPTPNKKNGIIMRDNDIIKYFIIAAAIAVGLIAWKISSFLGADWDVTVFAILKSLLAIALVIVVSHVIEARLTVATPLLIAAMLLAWWGVVQNLASKSVSFLNPEPAWWASSWILVITELALLGIFSWMLVKDRNRY